MHTASQIGVAAHGASGTGQLLRTDEGRGLKHRTLFSAQRGSLGLERNVSTPLGRKVRAESLFSLSLSVG
jgi:hypothetical protein